MQLNPRKRGRERYWWRWGQRGRATSGSIKKQTSPKTLTTSSQITGINIIQDRNSRSLAGIKLLPLMLNFFLLYCFYRDHSFKWSSDYVSHGWCMMTGSSSEEVMRSYITSLQKTYPCTSLGVRSLHRHVWQHHATASDAFSAHRTTWHILFVMTCLCECVCACIRISECVWACMHGCACVSVCMCVSVCAKIHNMFRVGAIITPHQPATKHKHTHCRMYKCIHHPHPDSNTLPLNPLPALPTGHQGLAPRQTPSSHLSRKQQHQKQKYWASESITCTL